MNQTQYPLISCTLPTFNRFHFIPVTVKNFLDQTYPNKELVIVDDSDDEKTETFIKNIKLPNVHYHRFPKYKVGRKRNIAAEVCNGSIIAHWDDDDWYSPDRLMHQYSALTAANIGLTGYHTVYFYSVKTGQAFLFKGNSQSFIGSSMMYHKSVWKTRRFHDVQVGEDTNFYSRVNSKLAIDGTGKLIVVDHHGQNTYYRDYAKYLRLPNCPQVKPESITPYITEYLDALENPPKLTKSLYAKFKK